MSGAGDTIGAGCRLVPVDRRIDRDGRLCVVLPPPGLSAAERVILVTDVAADAIRGGHGYRATNQLIHAAAGSFRFEARSMDGAAEVVLDADGPGVVVPAGVVSALRDFSPGAVAVVVGDRPYDAAEVIAEPEA